MSCVLRLPWLLLYSALTSQARNHISMDAVIASWSLDSLMVKRLAPKRQEVWALFVGINSALGAMNIP